MCVVIILVNIRIYFPLSTFSDELGNQHERLKGANDSGKDGFPLRSDCIWFPLLIELWRLLRAARKIKYYLNEHPSIRVRNPVNLSNYVTASVQKFAPVSAELLTSNDSNSPNTNLIISLFVNYFD